MQAGALDYRTVERFVVPYFLHWGPHETDQNAVSAVVRWPNFWLLTSCNCADEKGRKQREYLHSDVRVDLPEAAGVNFQILRLCPEPYGWLRV